MLTLFDLAGKTALVTGSSQGIGLALAQGLGSAGASVILNGRGSDRLSAAHRSLATNDIEVLTERFDVTDSAQATAAIVDDAAFSAWLTARTPAGRWGEVDELVGACIFLASRASDFVNGQILYVDGGLTSVV